MLTKKIAPGIKKGPHQTPVDILKHVEIKRSNLLRLETDLPGPPNKPLTFNKVPKVNVPRRSLTTDGRSGSTGPFSPRSGLLV